MDKDPITPEPEVTPEAYPTAEAAYAAHQETFDEARMIEQIEAIEPVDEKNDRMVADVVRALRDVLKQHAVPIKTPSGKVVFGIPHAGQDTQVSADQWAEWGKDFASKIGVGGINTLSNLQIDLENSHDGKYAKVVDTFLVGHPMLKSLAAQLPRLFPDQM